MFLKVRHLYRCICTYLVRQKKVKSCLKDILKPVACNPVSQPTKPVPIGRGNIVLCNYLHENNINEEKVLFISSATN